MTSPTDRWIALAFAAFIFGAFALELARKSSPAALVVPAMVVAFVPLLVIHELGHALVARALGWTVARVVIGFGRPIARWRWRDTEIVVRLLPLGGHVLPAPPPRGAGWQMAIIYAGGPLAELLVLGLIVVVVGSNALLTPSQDLLTLLAQGLCATTLLSVLPNLVPLPTDGGVTDGLGLLTASFLPPHALELQAIAPLRVQAETHLRRGDPGAAARVFAAALAESPHSVPLRFACAECLLEAEQPQQAGQVLEPLLESSSLPPAWQAHLHALVASAARDLPAGELGPVAEEHSRRALELDGENPEFQVVRASVLLAAGRVTPAHDLLRQARARLPTSALVLDECECYLALAEHQRGDTEEAARLLRRLRHRGARGWLVERVAATLDADHS